MTFFRTAGIGLALTGVLGCAQSARCDAATTVCAGTVSVVALGQDITLVAGKTVTVENTRVRLAFDRVLSDSRCPTDVQCVWAGNATARVRVWVDSDTTRTFELNTNVGAKEAAFDGYTLRLVALAPDPVSTSAIDTAAYRLTIRLERLPQ